MCIEKLKIVVSVLCVFLFLQVTAQKQVTDFGAFTPEEMNLKQCEFDKDADAVVLFDKANSNYNEEHNMITERRIRLKILKERGIERGNIDIRYYSGDDFEFIYDIDATVLNIDGQGNQVWSKLDRKAIYKKKLNNYYSEMSFALPNIKVGSIIEYKYKSMMKHYGGLKDWTFQSDMPVLLSSYYLTIIPNAEFAYSVYKAANMHVNIQPDSRSGAILFEMTDIPGLREEAYMGAARDYLQRVNFQFAAYKRVESTGYGNGATTTTKYSTTWKELATSLLDNSDFGTQLNKSLPLAEDLIATWTTTDNQLARMKAIHDYVRSNFSWDHIYSRSAINGLKNTWEKKAGTSGDINLVLVNLLKAAGLPVQPLLVSERDYGKIDTSYPFVDQFDKVVAYVTIEGKTFILDGTDRETPTGTIPFKLLNTIGFVVDKKNGALVKIVDDVKRHLNIVHLNGVIDNNGKMQVTGLIDNYDYSKIERREKYNRGKSRYEKELLDPYIATTADTIEVTGLDSDSLPLHHDVKLHNYMLNKTGDYYLLNSNLFTGLNKNPFVSEHRFSDINFGCKYTYSLSGTFYLPSNLMPEALPKNVRLVLPDKSMTLVRQVEQSENIIQIGIRVTLDKTEYAADEYPEVQAFYKQMLELLNEPIVLKAKT